MFEDEILSVLGYMSKNNKNSGKGATWDGKNVLEQEGVRTSLELMGHEVATGESGVLV